MKNRKRLGTILLNTFAVIFMIISIIMVAMPPEILKNVLWLMLSAVGVSLTVAFIGFAMRWKSWETIKVRVFIESIGESGISGYRNVIFETENTEILIFDISNLYIRFSEGDVGDLYYQTLEKDKKLFDRFKLDGKSISLSFESVAGEQCKNCGSRLCYDKFSTTPICNFCSNLN